MSWSCPYLLEDGKCELRNKGCEPLAKGCVMSALKGGYQRLKKPEKDVRIIEDSKPDEKNTQTN